MTIPRRRKRAVRQHGLAAAATLGSGIGAVASALLSQYRFNAPWILMNQTNAPTIGSSSHSPVQPVNGAWRPSAAYIFPTSEGIRTR